jgi:hypothetical protein
VSRGVGGKVEERERTKRGKGKNRRKEKEKEGVYLGFWYGFFLLFVSDGWMGKKGEGRKQFLL